MDNKVWGEKGRLLTRSSETELGNNVQTTPRSLLVLAHSLLEEVCLTLQPQCGVGCHWRNVAILWSNLGIRPLHCFKMN